MNHVEKGHYYEQKAADYLISCGYQILEANYRCRYAEIDLIAMDGDYLVFVEVKYRRSDRVQAPSEAVNRKKQQHISLAARQYMVSRGMSEEQLCRFDVVAFLKERPVLYKNAFEYQGAKGW
ncbi:MAG: YraN family protein [Coprococcus sp.]|uniref:YraN family protein n=1 Tax=Coprococcus catus TaxID=116085 RepID=UPI001C022924|nr:YraN family protein [Coprococcus catus]MBT9771785.1 YraN family protein [Coprococcus catus]